MQADMIKAAAEEHEEMRRKMGEGDASASAKNAEALAHSRQMAALSAKLEAKALELKSSRPVYEEREAKVAELRVMVEKKKAYKERCITEIQKLEEIEQQGI